MRHVLGIDVGGTNARAACFAVSDAGEATIVARARRRIRDDTSPEAIAAAIVALRDETCAGRPPIGVGVGLAAQLGPASRIVRNAPNLGWRDEAFHARVAAALGASAVTLVNDLNAIALGETRQGGGRGHADLLAVYVGTGIGAGVVVGGELYVGRGNAGEIGHLKVAGAGEACGCGQIGCVEAIAGGLALERALTAALDGVVVVGSASGGEAAGAVPTDRPSLAEIGVRAAAGDAWSRAFWARPVRALGDAIAAGVTLLDPSALLLGGGVLAGAPWVRAEVVARVRAQTVGVAADVAILEGALGDDAGVTGAALAALDAGGPS